MTLSAPRDFTFSIFEVLPPSAWRPVLQRCLHFPSSPPMDSPRTKGAGSRLTSAPKVLGDLYCKGAYTSRGSVDKNFLSALNIAFFKKMQCRQSPNGSGSGFRIGHVGRFCYCPVFRQTSIFGIRTAKTNLLPNNSKDLVTSHPPPCRIALRAASSCAALAPSISACDGGTLAGWSADHASHQSSRETLTFLRRRAPLAAAPTFHLQRDAPLLNVDARERSSRDPPFRMPCIMSILDRS